MIHPDPLLMKADADDRKRHGAGRYGRQVQNVRRLALAGSIEVTMVNEIYSCTLDHIIAFKCHALFQTDIYDGAEAGSGFSYEDENLGEQSGTEDERKIPSAPSAH